MVTDDSEIVDGPIAEQRMKIFVNVFKKSAIPVMKEFGEEKANEFKDELVYRIASQSFNWRPLKPEYRLYKIKNRLDPRMMISTGEYINSIEVNELDDQIGYSVGVPNRLHNSGLSLRVLARIHEFGTIRIPARPHWRPQISAFIRRSDELGRELCTRIVNNVQGQLG